MAMKMCLIRKMEVDGKDRQDRQGNEKEVGQEKNHWPEMIVALPTSKQRQGRPAARRRQWRLQGPRVGSKAMHKVGRQWDALGNQAACDV